MPENTYEITYIVNNAISDDHIRNVIGRVAKLIEKGGGELIESDEWGAQRLAYPIAKKRTGHYVNAYFKAPGEAIARLERALSLEDDILRYLTLKMDAPMLRHYAKRKEEKAREEAEAASESAAEQEISQEQESPEEQKGPGEQKSPEEQASPDEPAESSPAPEEVQAEAPAASA